MQSPKFGYLYQSSIAVDSSYVYHMFSYSGNVYLNANTPLYAGVVKLNDINRFHQGGTYGKISVAVTMHSPSDGSLQGSTWYGTYDRRTFASGLSYLSGNLYATTFSYRSADSAPTKVNTCPSLFSKICRWRLTNYQCASVNTEFATTLPIVSVIVCMAVLNAKLCAQGVVYAVIMERASALTLRAYAI